MAKGKLSPQQRRIRRQQQHDAMVRGVSAAESQSATVQWTLGVVEGLKKSPEHSSDEAQAALLALQKKITTDMAEINEHGVLLIDLRPAGRDE